MFFTFFLLTGSEQVPNFEVEEDSGIGSATVNESSRSPDDNLEPGL